MITTKYPRSLKGKAGSEIGSWTCPKEINSGAISKSKVHPSLFEVEANTAEGPMNFIAFLKSQCEDDEFRGFIERLTRLPLRNPSPFIPVPASSTTQGSVKPSTINENVEGAEEVLNDWRSCPSEILAKMQDTSISQDVLFEAVLFAEVAKFDETQTKQLLPLLFAFAGKYRFSQEETVITTVGAAIRKLAMNLSDSQIEQYADLFPPTDTDTLPCEIELELTKAIVWRLTTAPANLPGEFPVLESRLAELASDYLAPRLILQKNYASIVLQAVVGVLLLGDKHTASILSDVRALKFGWFTDLLQRRLARLRRKLSESCSPTPLFEKLKRFESELQSL